MKELQAFLHLNSLLESYYRRADSKVPDYPLLAEIGQAIKGLPDGPFKDEIVEEVCKLKLQNAC